MKRFLERYPQTAVIVSIVALVMATVGTGYAALKLPKNSVGSKQLKKNSVTAAKLKKNSVTGAKVKDQSLTGKDINLAKLGTVPAASTASTATTANTANLANSIPPAEATHYVGAPGEPGFESGSSNYPGAEGVNFNPVGFYKDHEGIVHLTGLAKVGEASTVGIVFRLPPGFRPKSGSLSIFTVFCSGSGKCVSDSPGNDDEQYTTLLVGGSSVSVTGADLSGAVVSTKGGAISLDGITFKAES